MLEIRFERYKEGLIDFLEENEIMLIEDDFDKRLMYTIYCEADFLEKVLPYIFDPTIKNVEDTGWEFKWKEFLQAGNLTENIRYVFDKDEYEPGRDILINPALAFGTGNHPTTQLAATLLEEVCNDKSVLDVGCGSGILSIAAKISGAKSIYAFDNDSIAIGNTKENLILNNANDIFIWAGVIDSIKKGVKFDIVVANIISSVLLELKDSFIKLCPDIIIFSGILLTEKDEFLCNFDSKNYFLDKTIEKNGWIGLRYRRIDV